MNKKKYRVTINAGYRETRFEFDGCEYSTMTRFVSDILNHRVKADRDDEDDDLGSVEIKMITESQEVVEDAGMPEV